jgi:hypothetical protein
MNTRNNPISLRRSSWKSLREAVISQSHWLNIVISEWRRWWACGRWRCGWRVTTESTLVVNGVNCWVDREYDLLQSRIIYAIIIINN